MFADRAELRPFSVEDPQVGPGDKQFAASLKCRIVDQVDVWFLGLDR